MKLLCPLIFLTLTTCNPGKEGVKYDEMFSKPTIHWNKDELIINTVNSKENSALLIYKIEPTVNTSENTLLLKGYQAVGKEFRTEFKFSLKDLGIKESDEYKVYWVDPDGKQSEVKVE